jgi:hypothetical protein
VTDERRTQIEEPASYQAVDLEVLLKDEAWIGLTWAVDWIAFRGMSFEHLDEDAYNASIDEAARQMISRLAQLESNLPPGTPLKLAKGVWEGEEHLPDAYPTELLWGDASLDIADYDRGKYVLVLTGSHDSDGATGALIGRCKSWVRISVTTKFIRKHWPPAPRSAIGELPKSHFCSDAEVMREVKKIVAACPPEIMPLPKDKMLLILRHRCPGVTKKQCQSAYESGKGKGPRLGRSREETRKLYEEFIQKMTAAEFRN